MRSARAFISLRVRHADRDGPLYHREDSSDIAYDARALAGLRATLLKSREAQIPRRRERGDARVQQAHAARGASYPIR